eukprot:CAMPEP_0198238694 /NCGR_PEP_ID=MMETSP1446-20131203/4296_1 /TAXON_ID=1461542 ORGANISM="Unidentified sp, Strain CCMP2111" /NCGR_SAMPLE_ID=MMETSP1446 /ASSEMBLY_ACC=CAM_ASM_001112 /LENGTH=130 /DNA_ID=CAMNT_0043921161 /DNA_START=619 /DNA_END=1009 /DNA_ORIENTATION=-
MPGKQAWGGVGVGLAIPHAGVLSPASSVRAPLGEPSAASRGLAQHRRAGPADDDGLRVREHGRDVEAPLALDVHEEAVGALHQALQLVTPPLVLGGGVQEVYVARQHHRPSRSLSRSLAFSTGAGVVFFL